jgi:PBSX family phage terminase large subunit
MRPVDWTCNPDHPSHKIKTDYIDNPNIDVKNYFFGFPDNPIITQDYIDNIKRYYKGAFYERMILGKWVAAEGTVYDHFDRSIHVVDSWPENQVTEFCIGIDWGYEHHLALGLYAIDYDGAYWMIDEIFVQHQLIDKELVQIMRRQGWFDLSIGDRRVLPSYAYADSARPEYVQLFQQLTGLVTVMASKEVIEGIQCVQRHLTVGGNGKARLYILNKCNNMIHGMETYRWKKNNTGTKDEPEKKEDDMVDQLRYTLHTRERSTVRLLNKNPLR